MYTVNCLYPYRLHAADISKSGAKVKTITLIESKTFIVNQSYLLMIQTKKYYKAVDNFIDFYEYPFICLIL